MNEQGPIQPVNGRFRPQSGIEMSHQSAAAGFGNMDEPKRWREMTAGDCVADGTDHSHDEFLKLLNAY